MSGMNDALCQRELNVAMNTVHAPTKSLAIASFSTLLLAAFALAGCAKYQFELVEPAQHANVITRDEPVDVHIDPLVYVLREYDRQLVIRIINENDEPATIHGERSYVVDPEGETHPLRGGTIAPSSFITFGVPPIARYYRSGPQFGFGVGVGTSFNVRQHHHHHHYHDPFYYSRFDYAAWYYEVPTWRWKTGDVRLRLVGTVGEQPFDHEFLFTRLRVD